MVVTSYGLSGTALRIGSNVASPGYIGIGNGSAAITTGRSGLVSELLGSRMIGSKDFTTPRQLTFTSAATAQLMSGTTLKEIGLFDVGSVTSGTSWKVDGFAGIDFDGGQELEVVVNWTVF